ncbi:hypothetical protein GW746_00745 [Candidatus Saccharibacteria bacterium]|nr:hypothetical protein [Candidatus Saccharibacteria bacterium]NCS82932.1 hypothetical protein [Candidatus Saccharibacteria bacterium]
MDISPQNNTAQQPMSDDQELAKALAGVMTDEPDEQVLAQPSQPAPQPETAQPAAPAPAPVTEPVSTLPSPSAPPVAEPTTAPVAPAENTPVSGLDSIKKDALNELRPLVDKVDIPAEEKFDIYLMLIRSTDDSSLIAPAHAAAQGIEDDKKRAESLLEVIKEIDYLSKKG